METQHEINQRNALDGIGKVPFVQGLRKDTDTTGVVKGEDNIKEFIQKCKSEFNEVLFTDMKALHRKDYLQYTLYTGNRIMLFYTV